jgi:RHS repeat-associated protein
MFKLRLSYGALGNQNIGLYRYIPTLSYNTHALNYPFDGRETSMGYAITAFPSSNIKWETTVYKNIGVDISLWNNKLELSAEAYIKNTRDMLSSRNISLATGYNSSILVNDGKLRTTGFEMQAIYHGKAGGLKYDLDLNLSHYKSVLKSMANPDYLYEYGALRTYVGGEIGESLGSVKEKLYLGGGYYDAPAVLIKEGNRLSVFFIHRDYLGSILQIADAQGNVVEENSFDAWGRLRNPATQTVYAPGTEPELMLDRGFTGHEHLSFFGLINMNARLYDPVLGRFLSPDPYVQVLDFTQSYNRYMYAMNNPLCYVDRNGEFLWFVPVIIGAAIGMYSGGVIANKGQYNPVKWDWSSNNNRNKPKKLSIPIHIAQWIIHRIHIPIIRLRKVQHLHIWVRTQESSQHWIIQTGIHVNQSKERKMLVSCKASIQHQLRLRTWCINGLGSGIAQSSPSIKAILFHYVSLCIGYL